MYQLTIEVDPITEEVRTLMNRISKEFDTHPIEITDYVKRAVKVCHGLGYEYFYAASITLASQQFVGGTLVRAAMENYVNLRFVRDNEVRSKKLIEQGMNRYVDGLAAAGKMDPDEAATQRAFNDVNEWFSKDNDTITKRIKAVDPKLINVYDFYSYFTHPNPGIMWFLSEPNKPKRAQFIMEMIGVNDTYALKLMKHTIEVCELKSVTIEDLNAVAKKMQFELTD